MRSTCKNCGKSASSMIEFNSLVICPACFDRHVSQMASEMASR